MDTPGPHITELETDDETMVTAPAKRHRPTGWQPGTSSSSADPTVFATVAPPPPPVPEAEEEQHAPPPHALAPFLLPETEQEEHHAPPPEAPAPVLEPEQPLVEDMTSGEEGQQHGEQHAPREDEGIVCEEGSEGLGMHEGQEMMELEVAEEERPLEKDPEVEVEDEEDEIRSQDFGSAEEGWIEVDEKEKPPAEEAEVDAKGHDTASSAGSGEKRRRITGKTSCAI